MRYFSLFFTFLIAGIVALYFSYEKNHEYPIYTSTLSWVIIEENASGYTLSASVDFETPRTALYFSFPRDDSIIHSGTVVVWQTESGNIERQLDVEDLDMRGYETRVFSSPFITTERKTITFRIVLPKYIDPKEISLMSSYSEGEEDNSSPIDTYAATRIISRAEWWADESYRFSDSEYHQKAYQEYLTYRQSPKTAEQLNTINIGIERRKELERLFPDTGKLIIVKRFENGKRLVWPIQKTRAVNRIVIHHTAESLDKQVDDLTYIRDIYKYHALVRDGGWGDIGYNYIIWQRGKIYEWRAGGDYVVGGHVLANNEWTVGIAVIGNYETLSLNRDQKLWLESAITYLADKYGIDLSANAVGIKQCSGEWCRTVQTHITKSLIWHRDLDATVCPGKNIYAEIPWWISRLATAKSLKYNTETPQIDPIPANETMNMTPLTSTSVSIKNTQISSVQKTRTSPKIKIRLSYSGMTALLEWATVTPPVPRIGLRRLPFSQWAQASVWVYGEKNVQVQIGWRIYTGSSFSLEWEVVRVASWMRVPAWDTTGKYNDNIFRGKLTVRNQSGSLMIVNELPVEDYLKWLGEVSNTDLEQKIKTILVSARTYAYYYMDRTHRKYGTLLYDGSDDPDSFQRYLGYGYEMRSPRVAQYVDETFWQVVKYQWELIKTWYFSSSDGRTLSYQEYCERNNGKKCMNIPYLVSVSDPGWVWKVRNGHWVGISGIGATYFAEQWWDYKKIIQYYLKGVEIMKK